MAGLKNNTITLQLDGKNIDIKNVSKLNLDLNKALLEPSKFAEFVADPKSFAAQYDLAIDQSISNQLAARLSGVKNLADLQRLTGAGRLDDGGEATVWAVAVGSYSIASTKIAVAF